ncbi:LD-carboxypeptidase [Ureibacillus terrenus]|nr:LD-carboxypeptidase [Ureibacillus terrenus]
MIKPKLLKPGDTIGIISTSSPVAAACPNRFQRGISELERMGFKVKVGKNALKRIGHLAGTVEERLEDLHEMFQDQEV